MSYLIIKTKEGKDRYILLPSGKGLTLCYEIKYWRDAYTDDNNKEHDGVWRSMGKYASTVSDGLRLIAEDIQRNGDWRAFSKANTKSLKEAADVFSELLDSFTGRIIREAKEADGK